MVPMEKAETHGNGQTGEPRKGDGMGDDGEPDGEPGDEVVYELFAGVPRRPVQNGKPSLRPLQRAAAPSLPHGPVLHRMRVWTSAKTSAITTGKTSSSI